MNNYFTVLKALFKNKLRFGDNTTKGKKIGFIALIAFVYILVMAVFIMVVVSLRELLSNPAISVMMLFTGLLTVAVITLVFGIISLVSTLYLSKDTDFYSMLPIKSSTVFAAKVSFVYLSEAIITYAIMLPLLITFGIATKMWVGFYFISIIGLMIVPALPLFIAAIIAIPVMFIASKLKNRAVISLIFYIVMFGALIGIYMYFVANATDFSNYSEETILGLVEAVEVVLYVFYPYTVLAQAACGVPSFGLDLAGSTAANIAIFVGISLALIGILLLCAKFMYSQAVKANNQTDNSKAVKGSFKSSGITKSLIKREFAGAMRTTQVAFQCFGVVILPIVVSVAMGIISKNTASLFAEVGDMLDSVAFAELVDYYQKFMYLIGVGALATVFGTLGNAAATTFSREGAAMATLKVLPISPRRVVKGKVLAWMCIALPCAVISAVILNVFNFDPIFFVLSLIAFVALAIVYLLFGALWDLMSPKLKWTDPLQAVKHNGHVTAGQFITMAVGLIVIIAIMICGRADLDINTLSVVCWIVLYAAIAVFAVIDIILLRKVDKYYDRIEI